MIARADLLLVVTAVLVSAFFSPSMFPALAQTSTESGKEVREFRPPQAKSTTRDGCLSGGDCSSRGSLPLRPV